MSTTRRERRLDELAMVEFTGSMAEAFGRYAHELRDVATRWDVELALASTDVRHALMSLQDVLEPTSGSQRAAAKRVARRLRRAQSLVAGITKRAERLPKEYSIQFLSTPEATKAVIGGRK